MKENILRYFSPSPGRRFKLFALWGEKKKGEDQAFQGAFCLAETVSQKLVFDALNYIIATCSLILHVYHV